MTLKLTNDQLNLLKVAVDINVRLNYALHDLAAYGIDTNFVYHRLLPSGNHIALTYSDIKTGDSIDAVDVTKTDAEKKAEVKAKADADAKAKDAAAAKAKADVEAKAEADAKAKPV
jgi:hypothetical protein